MGCLCNRLQNNSRGEQAKMQAGAQAETAIPEGELTGAPSETVAMTAKIKKIATKAEFDKEIANAKYLVVVDFYATWCGPCKVVAPYLEKWADKFEDVIFCKVDVDENDETAEACCVNAMPTFHFYKDGGKVDELVGANHEKILEKIEALK